MTSIPAYLLPLVRELDAAVKQARNDPQRIVRVMKFVEVDGKRFSVEVAQVAGRVPAVQKKGK